MAVSRANGFLLEPTHFPSNLSSPSCAERLTKQTTTTTKKKKRRTRVADEPTGRHRSPRQRNPARTCLPVHLQAIADCSRLQSERQNGVAIATEIGRIMLPLGAQSRVPAAVGAGARFLASKSIPTRGISLLQRPLAAKRQCRPLGAVWRTCQQKRVMA